MTWRGDTGDFDLSGSRILSKPHYARTGNSALVWRGVTMGENQDQCAVRGSDRTHTFKVQRSMCCVIVVDPVYRPM